MNRPIVSIVGRPNVGKSTLFNRLVGKRISITEDTPGVTRDRHYQEIEWQNKYFILTDTGGLDLEENTISKLIETQVDIAIETSDLVIFLVDGKDGVTSLDKEIAVKLKKTKKKVIVVVNKIDTGSIPNEVYEFYELGFEDLLVISAEQSLGLGDLLDDIVHSFDASYEMDEIEDVLKLAIIGKPNVGKSSLVNRLLGEDRMIVSDIPGTTRDSIDSSFELDGKNYLLIDTAGLRRKSKIDSRIEHYSTIRTYNSIDRADICIFMIDATEGVTEQDTKIAGYAHNTFKPSVIVVNKWDLIDKDNSTTKAYETQIRNTLSFMPYAPILFVSVKDNLRISKIFDLVNRIDENYNKRVSTGTLNNVIREAVQISPPPSDKGKALKIFYVSQVSVAAPKFIFHVNDQELFHFSYLRYMENQIRKNFDFEGVPIKLEVRNRKE